MTGLIIVLVQLATVGLLFWLVRSFGAFSRAFHMHSKAQYYEEINLREEVRRLREATETISKQRSA